MKISQMTSMQAADVLVRIADPVANIMHDSAAVETIGKMANGSDNPILFFAENLVPVVTLLLGNHRADVFSIIAALSGKQAKDVSNQRFTQTVLDLKDCVDGDLVDFFKSQVPSKGTKPTE